MIRLKLLLFLFLVNLLVINVFYGSFLCREASAGESQNYTVSNGDCLWLIANKYGTTVEQLMAANGMSSDFLQIGQILVIPGGVYSSQPVTSPAPATGESQNYTVSNGDCLWLIANRFGTTVEQLKAANGLNNDMLYVGQELVIPGSSVASQTVSRGAVSRPAETYNAQFGELVEWNLINGMFPMKSTVTIQDFDTGRQFKIYHLFGTNHADCEPLTAEDSRIMKSCFGGQWSWERRAAIVWLNGRPVACSMAGMPHGTSQDIYGNDFDGHFDLHFLNSRTHGTNRVDGEHQAMVRKATGQ